MADIDTAAIAPALSEGFPPTTAEKVERLLGVLREIQARQATSGKFTLKGGTALNVFHFPKAPRLSVDIDLMATGFPNASPRSAERQTLLSTVKGVLRDLGYGITQAEAEAGWSLLCGYRNHLGSPDQIKLDLDLVNRITLLPSTSRDGPALFFADDMKFPVVSVAELFGQKLTAVAYRAKERDLFDMYIMLTAGWHRTPRARAMYLAYSFLKDHEWFKLAYPVQLKVPYEPSKLADVLRGQNQPPSLERIRESARDGLERAIPPFTVATDEEQGFRHRLLEGDLAAFADIAAEEDSERRAALGKHPALAWRLQQVKHPGGHKRSK